MPATRRAALIAATRATTTLAAAAATVAAVGCGSLPPGGGAGGVQVKEQATLLAILRSATVETDLQKQVLDRFPAAHPNIKLDVVVTDAAEYDAKTDTLLAAGTPPALWWPASQRGYRFYAARSQLEELDPLINRDRFDLGDFHTRLLSFCKWKGKYNALPITCWPQVLVYNKTLLDRERMAPPPRDWQDKSWTWAKYLQLATQATKREGDRGVQFGSSDPWASDRFYALAYGGDWFEPEAHETGYPRKLAPQKEAVIDGIQFLADLRHRHQVWPLPAEVTALRGGSTLNLFETGKVAMEVTSLTAFGRYELIKDFDWGVAAVPNPPAPPGLARNNWFYGGQWTFFKGQANKDAAWLLLKHMVSAESLRTWPLQQGAIPSRRSLSPDWTKFHGAAARLTEADLKVPLEAPDLSRISLSHAIVEFAEMWQNAIKPEQDKVLAGEQPMRVAFDKIAPVVQGIMERTAPR